MNHEDFFPTKFNRVRIHCSNGWNCVSDAGPEVSVELVNFLLNEFIPVNTLLTFFVITTKHGRPQGRASALAVQNNMFFFNFIEEYSIFLVLSVKWSVLAPPPFRPHPPPKYFHLPPRKKVYRRPCNAVMILFLLNRKLKINPHIFFYWTFTNGNNCQDFLYFHFLLNKIVNKIIFTFSLNSMLLFGSNFIIKTIKNKFLLKFMFFCFFHYDRTYEIWKMVTFTCWLLFTTLNENFVSILVKLTKTT